MSFLTKIISSIAKKDDRNKENNTNITTLSKQTKNNSDSPLWELTFLNNLDLKATYKCKNALCEKGFSYFKYHIDNAPDVANCPYCGNKMINEQLIDDYFRFTQAVIGMGSGTLERFKVGVKSWEFFCRYYDALKSIGEPVWKNDVPAIDCIFDVLSKISFPDVEKSVSNKYPFMKLERYPTELFKYVLALQTESNKFLNECVTTEPQKQVELVKELESRLTTTLEEMRVATGTAHPQYSDGKYYFYVWKNFDIVRVERKGRYNMIKRY